MRQPASNPLDDASLLPAPAKVAKLLQARSRVRPKLAMVLGSGFGGVLGAVKAGETFDYRELPGFQPATVPGHAGRLVLGRLGGVPVAMLCGRTHYYEGHSMARITFPIRVLAELGVESVVLTNAAGGIHAQLNPGDFMLFEDHINFMGANPLRGMAPPDRDRFVDLTATYDRGLQKLMAQAARKARVRLRAGVYVAVSGPSYETPAEIRVFARLGADAVGMSTVPEAIVARQCGLRVAAVSCITNPAAGRTRRKITHQEVLAIGQQAGMAAARLLENFAKLHAHTVAE